MSFSKISNIFNLYKSFDILTKSVYVSAAR